jgi:hypothetical protein
VIALGSIWPLTANFEPKRGLKENAGSPFVPAHGKLCCDAGNMTVSRTRERGRGQGRISAGHGYYRHPIAGAPGA